MDARQRVLILTFDYELFLGTRSGSVEGCLLRPTRALLEAMSAHSARAVFFVDTTYLLRLEEAARSHARAARDLELVSDQLRAIAAAGHDVFPHLHPHWVDGIYQSEIGEWTNSDCTRYRFASLSSDLQTELMDRSVASLRCILAPTRPDWSPEGHRAGGWSIQPFSDFASHYRRHGIVHDFSVASGLHSAWGPQEYDFTPAGPDQPYRFQHDPMQPDERGDFVELPISTIAWTARDDTWHRLWRRALRTLRMNRPFGDGIGVMATPSRLTPRGPSRNGTHEMASLDLTSSLKLRALLRRFEGATSMQIIGHPKMLDAHGLAVFRRFLAHAIGREHATTKWRSAVPRKVEAMLRE